MVDVFLIIVTIILTFTLFYVNFYLLALFCHRNFKIIKYLAEEEGWGAALFCKFLVVILISA